MTLQTGRTSGFIHYGIPERHEAQPLTFCMSSAPQANGLWPEAIDLF
jgi:hypothetical protein